MKKQLLGRLADLTVLVIGVLSLLSPFIFPGLRRTETFSNTFPLMVSLIIILCLLILFYETQAMLLDSKIIAFLGVLIAINAALRFLENAIPGPAGFSPTFFLIILTGYFFGSRIGFLMGAMTMFVSGLITGGVGPWLPGQMITAGWVGQSAAVLKLFNKKTQWQGKAPEIVTLAVFGAIWGLVYGMIMNLWFWPFLAGAPGQIWLQSANIGINFQRYLAYYLATSLVWDVTRAIGNILITSVMAKPVIKILKRFTTRFSFDYHEQRQS